MLLQFPSGLTTRPLISADNIPRAESSAAKTRPTAAGTPVQSPALALAPHHLGAFLKPLFAALGFGESNEEQETPCRVQYCKTPVFAMSREGNNPCDTRVQFPCDCWVHVSGDSLHHEAPTSTSRAAAAALAGTLPR